MSESDPAAPGEEAGADAGFADARSLTNYGGEAGQEGAEALEAPQPDLGRPATLPIDAAAARSFLASCVSSHPRVTYGLGAKVPFHGAIPGKDFSRVDCSGFVRELIWRATEPNFNFRDGSVVQHDWVKAQGFEKSSVDDGFQRDGVIRIAFLPPQSVPSGIGHVVLIHDGTTLESHGGLGPDSRPWNGKDWQAKTTVYVLTP